MYKKWWIKYAWHLLAIGLLLVALAGLFVDVMDVDASQYASISMEMWQDGSWLQVMHRHADYLDKPPLLFWSSAASYAVFGLSNWAYKLPSLLAALLGVFAVYQFTRLYYAQATARRAAFILASAVGLLVICNDVRTDTLLLGTSAAAVWQLATYLQNRRWIHLVGAFVFIGLAMLAKGPIGLVMPALAAGTHVALRRDWRDIFRWQWLPGLLLTALVLAPMCWGLYQQFDLHPEKTVNERNGVSGLYFYFWEQSFGRITGENVWKNDTGPLYFTHVYAWAFLPWPLLLLLALWQSLKGLWQKRFRLGTAEEGFAIGGFLLTFVALSLSKYKLPHYIFVTLPWAAVLTARYLDHIVGLADPAPRKWAAGALRLTIGLMCALAALLLFWVFKPQNVLIPVLFLAGLAVFYLLRGDSPEHWVQQGVWASVLALFILNVHFYPQLLPWQSTSAAAHYLKDQRVPPEKVTWYLRHGHAFDFYTRAITHKHENIEEMVEYAGNHPEFYVYTNEEGMGLMQEYGLNFKVEKKFDHYQAALLRPQFLNPATRISSTEPRLLLKVEGLKRVAF
ncbi:MAG: glycosyltransferase family 39 protein [Chitinophagales bacterium]|nr:glycosyltransferase family 39 protein [Chitinophagales bacterium]